MKTDQEKGLNQRWAKLSSSTLKHRWHCDQQPARKQQITTPEQTQCDVWDERGQQTRRKRSRFHSFLLAAPWSRAYKTQNHFYFFPAFVFRCLRLFLFLSDITFLSLGQSARTGEGLKYCMETQTHTHTQQPFLCKYKRIGSESDRRLSYSQWSWLTKKGPQSSVWQLPSITYLNKSLARRRWRIKDPHVTVTQAEVHNPEVVEMCHLLRLSVPTPTLQSFFSLTPVWDGVYDEEDGWKRQKKERWDLAD